MGLAFAAELPAAAALLRCAGELAGCDAEQVLEAGGPAFARTGVIQPLLTAVGLGAAAVLADRGIAPEYAAGHSLGELAAWSVAGAFSAMTAVEIAARRGAAMERESAQHPGGMIAVAGHDEPAVRELVRIGSVAGSVVVAAHNAAQDWTLSGDRDALNAIASRTAVTRLPVAGAWHSPAMAGAVADVRAAVGQVRLESTVQVVCNRTGAIAPWDADIGELLAGQLVRPVQWVQTLAAMAVAGVTEYIVLGPSKLLRSLVHRCHGPRARVIGIETPDDLGELAR
jgi:[acyl-carrier-protein] S-malonyltransferase